MQLAEQAKVYFEKGVSTRDTGDDYVKVTVFLATVLLLTALSQRFRVLGPRIAVAAVAVDSAMHQRVLAPDPPACLEAARHQRKGPRSCRGPGTTHDPEPCYSRTEEGTPALRASSCMSSSCCLAASTAFFFSAIFCLYSASSLSQGPESRRRLPASA